MNPRTTPLPPPALVRKTSESSHLTPPLTFRPQQAPAQRLSPFCVLRVFRGHLLPHMRKGFHMNAKHLVAAFLLAPVAAFAQSTPPAAPYKILTTTQIPAAGGIDYVTADSAN